MLIPQGMAYALLAGLPPLAGLYAAMVPLLLYPFFGTSRHLSVGPVAMDSLLVASGIGIMAQQGSDYYLELAILLAIMVGFMQFLMGILKLGFLVNFLSQPLINGFTSAAAIIIGLSQFKHILGVEIEGSQQVHLVLWRIIQQSENIHSLTLIIGASAIVLMLLLKKWKPTIPAALVAVILTTCTVWLFDLENAGVSIVGTVPAGLPHFQFHLLEWSTIYSLIPIALTISLISFMEAIAVAKKVAEKEGYQVSSNKELIALGICNFSAGIFGGYPIAGSFSRTAVNAFSGAQTGVSSIVNGLVVGITLLFLTPLFYYMPKAVLGAIVVVAVLGLIDTKEPARLFSLRMQDFLVLVFAFTSTLLMGARVGILVGALMSLVLIIRRISRPNIALIGRVPGTKVYRNMKRVPEAKEIEGMVIFRIDASLYYANSVYLKDKVQESIALRKNVKTFVIDATSINEIDSTAVATLHEIADELQAQGIQFQMVSVKTHLRDILIKGGIWDKLGDQNFFFSKEFLIDKHLSELIDNKDREKMKV